MSGKKDEFLPYTVPYTGSGAQAMGGGRYAPSGQVVGGTVKQSDLSRLATGSSAYSSYVGHGSAAGFVSAPGTGQMHGSVPSQSNPSNHSGCYSSPTYRYTGSTDAPFVEVPPARFQPAPQYPQSFIGMPQSTAGTRIAPTTNCDTDNSGANPRVKAPFEIGASSDVASNSSGEVDIGTCHEQSSRPALKRNSASLDLIALAAAEEKKTTLSAQTPKPQSHLAVHKGLDKSVSNAENMYQLAASDNELVTEGSRQRRGKHAYSQGPQEFATRSTAVALESLGLVDRSPNTPPLDTEKAGSRRSTAKTDSTWDRSTSKNSSIPKSDCGTDFEIVPASALSPGKQSTATGDDDWVYISHR